MPPDLTDRPFRLLMTTDAVGGIWRYSLDLAEALAPENVEVTLVGFGPRPDVEQRAEAARVARLAWFDLPLDWQAAREEDLAAIPEALTRVIAHYAPDAVQLNLPSQADGLDVDMPVVVVAHSCVVTWFKSVRGATEPADWRWQRRKVWRGLNAADAVVAPTEAFAELLRTCYGPLPNVHVVKNATRGIASPAARRPFAMAAGRWWDEGKNAAVLDRAAALTPLPVKAAGATRGPDGQATAFSHVEALGPQSHATVAALLATADVVVSPSIYEPFGLVALEAASAGGAMVLSDIPAYRELWTGCALFFQPNDEYALAMMIDGLARDPGLRRALGDNARARAATLSPDRQAGAMARLYRAARAEPRKNAEQDNRMKFVFYTQSLISDWNHGNAHFLRGIMSELIARGHDCLALEPEDSWSRANLVADQGEAPVARFKHDFPDLVAHTYGDDFDHEAVLADADVVLVHEWNTPDLVRRLGHARRTGGAFTLLFHDTHHRAVSASEQIAALALEDCDAILAFGATLTQRYRDAGWGGEVFTWHEAADARVFKPLPAEGKDADLIWIGNWGDDERKAELETFLIEPVRRLGIDATVHGVRYPGEALDALARAGITYDGWIANAAVPRAFARHRVTVHVPRRPYVKTLPGIPTIRVFEALACGIPLVSAPWNDAEGLFRPGRDFLFASNGEEMTEAIGRVLADPDLADSLVANGLETVRSRHTCAHRVDELMEILSDRGTYKVRDAIAERRAAQ